jgi:hypothetical protein
MGPGLEPHQLLKLAPEVPVDPAEDGRGLGMVVAGIPGAGRDRQIVSAAAMPASIATPCGLRLGRLRPSFRPPSHADGPGKG